MMIPHITPANSSNTAAPARAATPEDL